MRKKRILAVGEASFLATGFSVYSHEVLKRLHATGKYELAELSCYAPPNDPRFQNVPWKAYPNVPAQGEEGTFHSTPINQFGQWRFEPTLIDFKPDIVWDVRDWWMLEFQERSPLRKYFYWAIMPTVDSAPQDEQWLSTYMNANAVTTYSDWGLELLRKQGNGKINTICSTPPGADLEVFRPIDKQAVRNGLGINPNALVIGTVMRNQKRKLYPDLIQAFAQFLREAPESIAKRAYLLLHTSFPDVGWDLPLLVKEAGVGSRVLFTYACRNCGGVRVTPFRDMRAACNRCGAIQSFMPNSGGGLDRGALNAIYNAMDCYVQYATCEGFGMPMVEAGAVGLHVFATDYSAMEDVVRKIHGTPVKVQRLFRESETHCWRALPDNTDFVQKLIGFFRLPGPVRQARSVSIRKAVEQHYNYDKTTASWEEIFDKAPYAENWNAPFRGHRPAPKIDRQMTEAEFVDWGLIHVAGRPDMVGGFLAQRLVCDLERGVTSSGGGYQPYNRGAAYDDFTNLCNATNHWEYQRATNGGWS
jgi:glycosyltransferase involved in cell wall biosynthesis